MWRSLFTSEPTTILKHCTTRWLSLLRCVNRYLAQLEGLLSCDEAETSKVESILDKFQHPLTKPILLFLYFILPTMDRFNCLFQKSNENTSYSEMSRLVHLYASNLLKGEAITAVGDNLTLLSFSRNKQLEDEILGIGSAIWANEKKSLTPNPFSQLFVVFM